MSENMSMSKKDQTCEVYNWRRQVSIREGGEYSDHDDDSYNPDDYEIDDNELSQLRPPGSQYHFCGDIEDDSVEEAEVIVIEDDDSHEEDEVSSLPMDVAQREESQALENLKPAAVSSTSLNITTPSSSRSKEASSGLTQTDSFDESFWQEAMEVCQQKELEYEQKSASKKRKVNISSESTTTPPVTTKTRGRSDKKTTGKKSRVSEDPPLLQQSILKFRRMNTLTSQKRFLDTPEKKHLEVNGTLRIYKKGETFKSGDFLFTITGFSTYKNQKWAMFDNGVSMHLKNTFIGPKHAKTISDDLKWCREFGAAECDSDPLIVRSLRMPMFDKNAPSGNMIRLRFLEGPISAPRSSPDPFWVYDCGPVDSAKSMSDNYQFAYLSKHMLDPTQWITRSQLPEKPVVLDLFGGMGAMHYGFKKAGFSPRSFIVEKNPVAAATLKVNFPEAEVFDECVHVFLKNAMDVHMGYPQPSQVHHIHSSSPCQGLSTRNPNTNNGRPFSASDLENNALSYVFVDFVAYYRPKFASFENVVGILKHINSAIEYVRKIAAGLIQLGYQCRLFIINSKEHGDPQKRRRVIMFAARHDVYLPDAPPPNMKQETNVEEVLANLYDTTPTAGSGRAVTSNGKLVTRHSIEGGLDWVDDGDGVRLSQIMDGKATTVRRQNPIKHPIHDRQITVRERARLMSIPDELDIMGSPKQQRDQIGNAVPVNTAICLAEQIMVAHLKELRP